MSLGMRIVYLLLLVFQKMTIANTMATIAATMPIIAIGHTYTGVTNLAASAETLPSSGIQFRSSDTQLCWQGLQNTSFL